MGGFYDQALADIDNVFLNTDEFGEEVTINGIAMACVAYDDGLQESGGDFVTKGVYRGEKTIQVKASLLPGKPSVNSRVTYQGEPYFLISCEDEMGMYVMRIGANRT